MTDWEQLLTELPEDIAEEFRVFAGGDEGRQRMLLDNYHAKRDAIARSDRAGFLKILEEEESKLLI